jgi:hypothetical protein
MKTGIRIKMLIFIFPLLASFSTVTAQEKIKQERERELTIQEEIDLQKKAIVEQRKAHREMEKALQESREEIDKALESIKPEVPIPPDNFRVFSNPGSSRSFSWDDQFLFSLPDRLFYGRSEDAGERSTWDFSKSVKESSFSNEYAFNVDKSAKTVVMFVTGDCKAGEIRIKISMPNGKTYSDILVDESGNLNWRKSFNINEEENRDKIGEWKYEIRGSKATGFFKISLRTF